MGEVEVDGSGGGLRSRFVVEMRCNEVVVWLGNGTGS